MAVIEKLIIEFNSSEYIDVNNSIGITMNNGSFEFYLLEVFKSARFNTGEVSIATTGEIHVKNAENFALALNLDGSPYGVQAVANEGVVEITFKNPEYYFIGALGDLIDLNKVTVTSETREPITPKSIEIESYSANEEDYCEDVNCNLEITGGNGIYNIYVNEVLQSANNNSPVTIPLTRGSVDEIRIVDSLGESIGSVTSINPRKVVSSDITTNIVNLAVGSTLTISVKYISPYVSTYTYSLSNGNFQEQNVFSGLASGDYTVYVKDALGCVSSKKITIDGFTELTETVFSISEINPLIFSKYELGKKNYLNTLSCNELRQINYKYTQGFLVSDKITTQFKTNAKYINVFSIDENLNTYGIGVSKRTENIGLTAKSTCTFFDLGDDRSGIYFGVVDLLNPLNNEVIGDADFGFTLPEWANKEGDFVTIEGVGQVKIDAIGYSEKYQSFILEFNISFSGSQNRKISSNYNLQPYEIYEFITTMNIQPTNFNIVIEVGSDSDNIEQTYISERISRVEDDEFLFDINYYTDDGGNFGDMVYQTGIKNKIRLKGYTTYLGEQTTEGYDGDKEYYVTDNTVYRSEKFSFMRVSTAMAHKLRLIFSHSYININGIEYQLAEVPEVPEKSFNNLKNFFVTLKSGGNQILTSSQEQITGTTESLEIGTGITAIQGKSLILWTKNNG